MEFIDTHCHPHFDDFLPDAAAVMERAHRAGVGKIIAVGTTIGDSRRALDFAGQHQDVSVGCGVHPHEAEAFLADETAINQLSELLNESSVIAVGEIGLDYYKNHSPREAQVNALRQQIELGLNLNLPFIFHVRDAWEDFWSVFDDYQGIRGVIHSFSSGSKQLKKALERDMYIGLNGIMTFTKDESQLTAARQVPLDKLVIETDAPFLTPVPHRGKVCEPAHVVDTARFLADLRGETLEKLAAETTANAKRIFDLI